METEKAQQQQQTTLVLGGTGKIGRRVAQRLKARGNPTRVGSRSGEPPFDWGDELTGPRLLTFAEAIGEIAGDGVRRALGREPKDFGAYARDAAATGIWGVGR